MYSNVLVPIDLEHPEQAGPMIRIATAIAIAGDDAQLTLLFAMPEIPSVVGLQLPEGMTEKSRAHAQEQLQELAKANDAPEATKIIVMTGRPHHKILELAERDGVDLIVLASHKPGLVDYLLGSVAATVAWHAKCAVHIMR